MKQLIIFVSLFFLASFTPQDTVPENCQCEAGFIPSNPNETGPFVTGWVKDTDTECPCQRGVWPFNIDCAKDIEDDCFELWRPVLPGHESFDVGWWEVNGACDTGAPNPPCGTVEEKPCVFIMEIFVKVQICCGPYDPNPEECNYGHCCKDGKYQIGKYCGGPLVDGEPPCPPVFTGNNTYSGPEGTFAENFNADIHYMPGFDPDPLAPGVTSHFVTRIVEMPCGTEPRLEGIQIECMNEKFTSAYGMVEDNKHFFMAFKLFCNDCTGGGE